MRLKILPYNRFSKSAKALARLLRVKRIVSTGYRQRRRETVLNWGAANPTQSLHNCLNSPYAVARAANKLETFHAFRSHNVPTVDWTTDCSIALQWLPDTSVVCRTLLNAHSGRGIVIADNETEMVSAPLYTKYQKKDGEYRVHVAGGQVIDFARKKKRNGYEENPAHDSRIRNHTNGWVFCRDGVVLPDSVRDAAIAAVNALGLDFGAVDVGTFEGRVFVFEVNSAPGLEGTTLERYANYFRGLLTAARRVPGIRSFNQSIANDVIGTVRYRR